MLCSLNSHLKLSTLCSLSDPAWPPRLTGPLTNQTMFTTFQQKIATISDVLLLEDKLCPVHVVESNRSSATHRSRVIKFVLLHVSQFQDQMNTWLHRSICCVWTFNPTEPGSTRTHLSPFFRLDGEKCPYVGSVTSVWSITDQRLSAQLIC